MPRRRRRARKGWLSSLFDALFGADDPPPARRRAPTRTAAKSTRRALLPSLLGGAEPPPRKAPKRAEDDHDPLIAGWLRELGFRAEEAKSGARHAGRAGSFEDRARAALDFLHPAERKSVNPGAGQLVDGALGVLGLTGPKSSKKLKRNASPAELLAEAKRQSREFHGSDDYVVDVGGKPHVLMGALEAVEYRAPRGSSRAGSVWRHEGGDRGESLAKLRNRSRLVADPTNGDLDIAFGPERFVASHGIVATETASHTA